jgi:hypothetical protein
VCARAFQLLRSRPPAQLRGNIGFSALYIFFSVPEYVLINKNCEPKDDVNGRNMFCKQKNVFVFGRNLS